MGEEKILYKELSYRIIGIAFDVYNELGYGHPEIYYERAIEKGLIRDGIPYRRQIAFKLMYRGEVVGRSVLDFFIDNKIVVELKKGRNFPKRNIDQVKSYLQATGVRLAILINFTPKEVKFVRVLKPNNSYKKHL